MTVRYTSGYLPTDGSGIPRSDTRMGVDTKVQPITLSNLFPIVPRKIPSTRYSGQEKKPLVRPEALQVPKFPSMKARELLQILLRKPLDYTIVRTNGSHRTLEAKGRPRIRFAYHDNRELSGIEVRDVLTNQVGLTDSQALEVIE